MKVGGGNGGHNGLRSIDPQIGTRLPAASGSASAIPATRTGDATTCWAISPRPTQDWLDPLLDAIADNAGMMIKGDDNGFMNKLALATQAGRRSAGRPSRPPKAQSHIRQARAAKPQAKLPETGPMAAMLKKLRGE